MSLIPDDNVFALGAVLFGLAWLGFWIDTNAIGRKTSGVVNETSGKNITSISYTSIQPFRF